MSYSTCAGLPYGHLIHGPLLIEDASSTLAVPADGVAVRDTADNIIITLSANAAAEDHARKEPERAVDA